MSAFVLNRKYELQLPSSFVDIDREEMEYVDGGYYVDINKKYVGWVIDGLLVVFGGEALVGGIIAAIRKLGARTVANKLTAVALAACMYFGLHPNQSRLFSAIYGLLGVIGITPGGLIADAIDSVDRSGSNGRIQF